MIMVKNSTPPAPAPVPAAAEPEARDWTRSTVYDRIRFLHTDYWEGDKQRMIDVTTFPNGLLRQILKGKEPELTPADLRKITTRIKSISPSWLLLGQGLPYDRKGKVTLDPGSAPATTIAAAASRDVTGPATPGVHRLRAVLEAVWHDDQAAMSAATEIAPDRLWDLLAARTPPDDDVFLAIAAADPRIRLDWLLSGAGPMLATAAAEPAPAPAPAPPVAPPSPPAPPSPTTALDGLVELLGAVRGFRTELDEIQAQLDDGPALAAQLDQVRRTQDQFAKQLNDFNGKVGAFREQASTAITAAAKEAAKEAVKSAARVSSQVTAAVNVLPETLRHADQLVERGNQLVALFERKIAEQERAREAHGTRLARCEAATAALDKRLDVLGRQLAGLHEQLDHRGPAPRDATDDRLDDHAEALQAMRQTLHDLCEAPDGLAARLRRLEDLAAAGPAAAPLATAETALDPDQLMAVGAWCQVAGSHQRLLRAVGDRTAMSRRLVKVCTQSGIPVPGEAAKLFPVRFLRWYVEWFATAGLLPSTPSWVQFWEERFTAYAASLAAESESE